MSESRAQLIWRHVYQFIHSTGISWPSYADTVRDIYEATIPEHTKHIEWSNQRDMHTRMRLDAQTLRRFEYDAKFGLPCDLEESLVLALRRHQYRDHDALMRDLAGRYGLLAARLPADSDGTANIGDLSIQFGEAVQALGPMLADGQIDENDVIYARRASRELLDVIAAANTLLHQVDQLLKLRSAS